MLTFSFKHEGESLKLLVIDAYGHVVDCYEYPPDLGEQEQREILDRLRRSYYADAYSWDL